MSRIIRIAAVLVVVVLPMPAGWGAVHSTWIAWLALCLAFCAFAVGVWALLRVTAHPRPAPVSHVPGARPGPAPTKEEEVPACQPPPPAAERGGTVSP